MESVNENPWIDIVPGIRFPNHFHLRHLQAEIIQNDRREDHTRDAHDFLPHNQPEQRQPNRIANAGTDDLTVQEIFQLVDDNEEDKRSDGDLR